MVAYNFQSQFVEPIRSGRKSHTIRKHGKRRHARPGEMLQLYTGMRTTACEKIIPDPECIAVLPIRIRLTTYGSIIEIKIGESILCTTSELEAFAVNDGFANLMAMGEFWEKFHGQPVFDGALIAWQPNKDKA